MEVKAIQKFIVVSPRKLREVAALVSKLTPKDAVEKLPFLRKRASEPLKKVIGTAIANAKQKGLKEDDLTFAEIQINEGPKLKRWRAGARGRAKPYKRRMSHIRVVLTTKDVKLSKEAKSKAEKILPEGSNKDIKNPKLNIKSKNAKSTNKRP